MIITFMIIYTRCINKAYSLKITNKLSVKIDNNITLFVSVKLIKKMYIIKNEIIMRYNFNMKIVQK